MLLGIEDFSDWVILKDKVKIMSEQAIEKEIQGKALNAPRLTPKLIDDVIIAGNFHVFPVTQLTVCCLTLKNGFTVTGESACASPENFDEEIGRKIAFQKARDKVWALEGYLLKQKLYEGESTTFATRLEKEQEVLEDKINKLKRFTVSEAFKELPAEAQALLIRQHTSMTEYGSILSQRLASTEG